MGVPGVGASCNFATLRIDWDRSAQDQSRPLSGGRRIMPVRGVHHRILYFFHGAIAAVISHGLVKEQVVPPKEIDRAVERKKRFEANPSRHTYQEA